MSQNQDDIATTLDQGERVIKKKEQRSPPAPPRLILRYPPGKKITAFFFYEPSMAYRHEEGLLIFFSCLQRTIAR